jgi:hypothetical protein
VFIDMSFNNMGLLLNPSLYPGIEVHPGILCLRRIPRHLHKHRCSVIDLSAIDSVLNHTFNLQHGSMPACRAVPGTGTTND